MKLRANFLKVFAFTFVAMLMLSSVALAQQAGQGGKNGQQGPDPKMIFANQPPFTENELTKFMVDSAKARSMGENEAAIKFLTQEGWTSDRFMYLAVKVGLTYEVLKRGGTKDVINQMPKEARPQKGELELVKKHKSKVEKLYAK